MPSTTSSLVRRLSAALATDLSGQTDLAQLTYSLVFNNLLVKIRTCSTRLDLLLKIVIPYIILIGGIYGTFNQVGTFRDIALYIWDTAKAPFTSKITVPAQHYLSAAVLTWLASHGVAKNAPELALASMAPLVNYSENGSDANDYDEGASTPSTTAHSSPPPSLNFIPNFGTYRFRYKGHFMSMERKNEGAKDHEGRPTVCLDPTAPQNLTLECFPTLRGTAPIQAFLSEVVLASAHTVSYAVPETMSTVFRSYASCQPVDWDFGGDSWTPAITRTARPIESVALEASKKDVLVSDIAYYLTAECERFYSNRGYPYRRGFLFYGPPGTGKTSFCLALAGHFKLNLYILSLGDEEMTDQRLESLFASLPTHCILLMEDVDSAGLGRELPKSASEKLHSGQESKSRKNYALTLSGLLNCLDGPTSKDGRIVCMTSNAPDSLDPALIRPGRCDQKVLFGYDSKEICIKLFNHLYTRTPDEMVESETSVSAQHDIAQLARDFAGAIPSDGKISPAEVQGYLMIHREDPVAAVEGARTSAKEIIEVKARCKNVAEHANEIEKENESK
jgi:chaperone BCS1